MKRHLLALPALCAGLALAACTGHAAGPAAGPRQPGVAEFHPGTCRAVAPDLLDIGRAAASLGAGPNVDAGLLARLTTAQDHLRQIAPGAEPAYQPALSTVVTAVGLVRLDARVGSYHRAQGTNLSQDYDRAVAACTGALPSAS